MRKKPLANKFAWLKIPPLQMPIRKAFQPMTVLMAVLLFPAICFSQKMTLNAKRITLKQVFEEIKKQTNYDVIYNSKLVETSVRITVSAKDQSLDTFLKTVLTGQPVTFNIVGTTIVVRKQEKPANNSGNIDPYFDSAITIEGLIADDETRGPISGVSIVNKRTGKGTQSDAAGKFTLKEGKEGDQITCSMIGYQSVTVPAGKTTIIRMKIAVDELDRAVVQAYGKTSRRLATGDITRISGEEIARHPGMNPLLALQGRVPGMIVTPVTGRSSSPVKVVLMGRNSVNKEFSPEPLYIIDGVPQTILDISTNTKYASNEGASPGYVQGGISNTFGQSPLFGINPRDIESMEILKDADALAIYGSRGANGVILITTKKARPGKTSFTLDYKQGIIDASRRATLLNTQDYLKYRREAMKNDGILPTRENAPDLMVYDTTRFTDWQKELYRTGKSTTLGAVISGGDIRNSFRLSFNYTNEIPLTMGKGKNDAISLDLSTSHSSADQKFKISAGVNYRYTFVDAVELGGSPLLPPNAPAIFDSVGKLNFAGWNPSPQPGSFPFERFFQPNIVKTNVLSARTVINYKVRDDLSVEVTGGFNSARNTNDNFITINSQDPRLPPNAGAIFSNTNASTLIVEPGIRYSRFVSKGRIEVMLGGSWQSTLTTSITNIGMGYSNDNLMGSISNAAVQQTSDGSGQYKYTALFGRINYNWENKYIINLNGRRDGSSRFAPGRQFGNFGSVGLSWNMSEEKWLRKLLPSWISFLKLRGSYGITGRDGIGDYQYMARWSVNARESTPMLPYNNVRPYTLLQPVNQVYHWEGTRMLSGGLDIGLFDNRINITATIQRNVAHDQLTSYPTPVYTGFASVVANSPAKILNVTPGLVIGGTLISQKDFQWSASFSIGTTWNKLLAYPALEFSPHARVYKIGESLSTEFLLHYIGVDPLTGEYRFEDYNKSGGVDVSSATRDNFTDDRYVAINRDPKYDGGFFTTITYKGASLSTGITFRKGWMKTSFLSNLPGGMGNIIVPPGGFGNYWQKPGDIAKYARLTTSGTSYLNNSDGGMMDVSYLQMGNISLSWSLNNSIVKKAGMTNCSIGLTLSNMFTLTRFAGLDPTVGIGMPAQRQILGNLSITF